MADCQLLPLTEGLGRAPRSSESSVSPRLRRTAFGVHAQQKHRRPRHLI
jgi:hypothetical protein